MNNNHSFSSTEARAYTEKYDSFYTKFAGTYDFFVRKFPFWSRWIETTLPYVEGPDVLEVSFGTGSLLRKYAAGLNVFGMDINRKFANMAHRRSNECRAVVNIQQADIYHLPYKDESFNTIVCTMAFSGYPDAAKAMEEIVRVLVKGGRLLLVDINHPKNKNVFGRIAVRLWKAGGDIIRDLDPIFQANGLKFDDLEVGGFGSAHLYVAQKQ